MTKSVTTSTTSETPAPSAAEQKRAAAAKRRERAARIREYMVDSGYSRKDATALVDAGF